ncbi:hypothetical protein D3C87_1363160 [compost metagenome]
MWFALISRAKNKAVKLPPSQYLPLSVKIIPAMIGAINEIARALLLCPAAIMIKLYEVKAKAIAPAAASRGFTFSTQKSRYAPKRYIRTTSTGSGNTVFMKSIT